MSLLVWRKQATPILFQDTSFVMDTIIEQQFYGDGAIQAEQEILRRLRQFEQEVSLYIPSSDIAQINALAGQGGVEVSPRTFDLIRQAKEYSEISQGTFDLTVAPLVEAWAITSATPRVPTEEELQQCVSLVAWQDVLLDEEHTAVTLARSGQAIDLGGIAKGYAAGIIHEVCQEMAVNNGFVSLGGNIIVIGPQPNGSPFLFGIRDPRGTTEDYILKIPLSTGCIATSGDYERYFEQDGQRYHHIFDPKTGKPAQSDLLSVSVVAADGAFCDFLSTALFVAGKEAALRLLDKTEFALIVVDQDKNVYVSDALRGQVEANQAATTYTFHID